MKRTIGFAVLWAVALALGSAAAVTAAGAHGLGVEVWTDRGDNAVYQPGEALQVKARVTDDAYLLVYEIDSEGYVRVLYPERGHSGLVSGRVTYRLPEESSDQQLVVQDPTGQDFMVAIASHEPFDNLPWYLRPYDPQGEDVGYVNAPKSDEEGVTEDGKIVGDPFVAMERIRRRALARPSDPATFATAYTTYYVHEQVRYPRYICNDCHRPGQWAWWDGWDPYYTHCSVVDFRVNWSWYWGPTYWTGFVPYYVYVPRTDCPPRWRWNSGTWYSSWDGWSRWKQQWSGPLVRYKSPPPAGYVPPTQWKDWHGGNSSPPPGFVTADARRDRGAQPMGRSRPTDRPRQPGVTRVPADEQTPPGTRDQGRERRVERPVRGDGGATRRPEVERVPARPAPRETPGREERPSSPPRVERPSPPAQQPRIERPRENRPKQDPARGGSKSAPKPKEERRDRGGV